MLKILKNMKPYWKTVLLIIILLFVQAISDLSLPTYTSDLIDVGIQNSGIEYATPTQIRPQQHELVKAVMTEEERDLWEASYTQGEDGNYQLNDTSSANLSELDQTFTKPIMIAYLFEQMDDTE